VLSQVTQQQVHSVGTVMDGSTQHLRHAVVSIILLSSCFSVKSLSSFIGRWFSSHFMPGWIQKVCQHY